MDGRFVAPALHLAADQGAIGLPACLWLLISRRLRMPLTHDLFHRLHNDLQEGLTSSGLMLIRLQYSVVAKMRRGPFEKQAHHSLLKSAAAELAHTMEIDSPLFEVMYEDIVSESDHLSSLGDIGSTAHMQATLAWVKDELAKRGIGQKVVTARCFSWEQTSRSASRSRFVDLLLLLYLGQQKKLWTAFNQCPLLQRLVPSLMSDVAQQEPDTAGGDAPPPEAEGPSTSRLSAAAGREEVRKLGQKTQNTLQFCTNLLVKDLNCRLWSAMCVLPQPLERFFSQALTMAKTQRSVCKLFTDLAVGSLLDIILEQLCWVGSEASAEAANAPPPPP